MMSREWFDELNQQIAECVLCPRLVAWRNQVATEKVKRYADETYWGRGVPSFGDPEGRVLIVGLAPAAHGANRTGRMFTGDRSGDWLYRALHKAGFANQPTSVSLEDGLQLKDAWITATAHCAPPDNKPLPEELQTCRQYLEFELQQASNVQVIVALGKIGFDAILTVFRDVLQVQLPKPKPAFGHGASYPLFVPAWNRKITLIGSYHPSQQNTFTGKLTEPMFDAVFDQAKRLLA